jgi:dolichyl-phosphate-mannose--protein O-mannosyl transferase
MQTVHRQSAIAADAVLPSPTLSLTIRSISLNKTTRSCRYCDWFSLECLLSSLCFPVRYSVSRAMCFSLITIFLLWISPC